MVVYATFNIKDKIFNLHFIFASAISQGKSVFLQKNRSMANTITIQIKDKKVRRILKSLEDIKLIQIIYESSIKWTPKKQKQAKDFLSAYESAQLHEKSKKKLKTAQSLLNEL